MLTEFSYGAIIMMDNTTEFTDSADQADRRVNKQQENTYTTPLSPADSEYNPNDPRYHSPEEIAAGFDFQDPDRKRMGFVI